jgi:hypothetical protein
MKPVLTLTTDSIIAFHRLDRHAFNLWTTKHSNVPGGMASRSPAGVHGFFYIRVIFQWKENRPWWYSATRYLNTISSYMRAHHRLLFLAPSTGTATTIDEPQRSIHDIRHTARKMHYVVLL